MTLSNHQMTLESFLFGFRKIAIYTKPNFFGYHCMNGIILFFDDGETGLNLI